VVGYIYDYTKEYYDTDQQNARTQKFLKTPYGIIHLSGADRTQDSMSQYLLPPIYPRGPFFSGYSDPMPQRFPYRHAGGGTIARQMFKIVPSEETKDRSIYIIQGAPYDHDTIIPMDYLLPSEYPYGRAARELHLGRSYFGLEKMPVIETTIDMHGNATLTGKCDGFFDLIGQDDAFNDSGNGSSLVSDFGLLRRDFLVP